MKQLVIKGKQQLGSFNQPIHDVNLLDSTIWGKFPVPRWFKNLRLKEFQACQGGNDRFYFCIALFNAKFSGLAQIRVYDKIEKKHYLIEEEVRPSKLEIANSLLDTDNKFESQNLAIHIKNRLQKGFIEIEFAGKDNISGSFKGFFNDSPMLVSSLPFSQHKGMYSQKGFVPMEGTLSIKDDVFQFNTETSFFVLDDHKGYYPYQMKWDWISTGFYQNGVLHGLNLTVNQVVNPENFNENRLWVGNKMIVLPLVTFKRTRDRWEVTSKGGEISLTFIIEYDKKVKISLGPLGGSNYEGPFGRVSGTIKTKDIELVIDNEFAFAEKQYIRC